MQILIKNLTFETIVGILEEERHTPQSVIVHAKIHYDYTGENFIDYAKVCAFIQSEMNHEKYFLLEDALKKLSEKIKFSYPQITKMKIKIFKPTILPNAMVGVTHKTNYSKN